MFSNQCTAPTVGSSGPGIGANTQVGQGTAQGQIAPAIVRAHVTQLKLECPGKMNLSGPTWVTYSTLGQG